MRRQTLTIAAFTFLSVKTRIASKKEGSAFFPRLSCSIKVLRCQLPKINKYYPEDLDSVVASDYFNPNSPASPFHYGNHLCCVCGVKASSKCSKCNVFYCCRDHQVAAWRNGHKESCGKGSQDLATLYRDDLICSDVQFPLWEVDMFPEPEPTKAEVASEQSQLERIKALNLGDEPVRTFSLWS